MGFNSEFLLSRRRAVISLGAGGIGAAIVARGLGVSAQESTPAATGSPAPILDPEVGLIEAQETALSGYEGAAVRSMELDYQAGELVWEIRLDNGVEVEIDALTGEVLRTEDDDDDDDDDDD